MAYIKRKATVYINWNEHQIMTQEEYERIRNERFDEAVQDDYEFRAWLEDEYTISEVFDMEECERDAVRDRWGGVCEERADTSMYEDGYSEEEVEVEVWVDAEPQQNLNSWKG